MENNFNRILFLTSFCFMACDGEIAKEEIDLIKEIANSEKAFGTIDIDSEIENNMSALKRLGNNYIVSYIDAVSKSKFNEDEELQLIDIAVKTIYADKKVEYSEILFFKSLRSHLNVSDATILEKISGVEDYWLEQDIIGLNADSNYLQNIDLSTFTTT